MLEYYQQYCKKLQRTGNYRQLPEDDQRYTPDLDFSSNDYLGLSRHPDVLAAGVKAAQIYGSGATGSRLLSGNRDIFTQLEQRIAQDKGTEAALVFNSGFQANLTVLSSLLSRDVLKQQPIVFFDRLNHTSLYQAVFLSGAQLVRYHHLDYTHLARCLADFQSDKRPKFIVTETLFGMDGDLLSLETLLELAHQYHALVYLDEAHALGILGPQGYGLSTTISHDVPTLVMGTLSKAVGCAGAYVAGNHMMIDFLINQAKGLIYSTAQSPFVIGAALKAWELIAAFDQQRTDLLALAEYTRTELKGLGFNTGRSTTHIIPMIIGHIKKMNQFNNCLREAGIQVSLIRRPSVPPQGERLRLALNIHHQPNVIHHLLEVCRAISL